MKHIKKFGEINEGNGDWIRTIQTLFDKEDVGSFRLVEEDIEMLKKWNELLPKLDNYGEIISSEKLGPIEESIRHFENKDLKKGNEYASNPTVSTAFGDHKWNFESYQNEYQGNVSKLREAWMDFLKSAKSFSQKGFNHLD